jgi:hypothetical protein
LIWVESRFSSFEQHSRQDRYELNADGAVSKHVIQCFDIETWVTRPVDESCKGSDRFSIFKRLGDFAFLKPK